MNEAKMKEVQAKPGKKSSRIAILSKCCDDWGGSEELWARSIPLLREAGVSLSLLKDRINLQHPRIAELEAAGVEMHQLQQATISSRLIKKIRSRILRSPSVNWEHINFTKYLEQHQPQLVVIAQGINFDGLDFAGICIRQQVPYIIICQKAVEFYWPPAHLRHAMRQAFEQAKTCFFVSQHNRQLTEEQFGFRFANARLIHNPVRFSPSLVPFPEQSDPIRLACIGRLFIIDKGQDILLRILSMEKWRSRNVEVSFIGTGPDGEGLRQMAELLGVKSVVFAGHKNNMAEVWQSHHALVLPSRSEGMPLVILEALAMGRPVIAARAGGVPEYVEEGVNGFLAEPNVADFDAAMERAWQQRHRWQQMGAAAVDRIREQVPGRSEEEFANAITEILYEK